MEEDLRFPSSPLPLPLPPFSLHYMHAMAQEVAAESSPVGVNPFSSWSAAMSQQRWPPPLAGAAARHADRSSASSYEEAENTASFAHEALSMDSSSAELSGEPVMADNQIWSQLLLCRNIGSTASQVQNNGHGRGHEEGESAVEGMRLQRRAQAFNSPCDYLKKMDANNYSNSSSWELISSSSSTPSSINNTTTFSSATANGSADHHLVIGNWSIAPPINSNSSPNSMPHHHVIIKHENSNILPINYHNIDLSCSSSYLPSNSTSTNYLETSSDGFLRRQQQQQQMMMNPNDSGIIRSSYQFGDLNIGGGGRGGGMITEAAINPSLHENNLSDQISFGRCSLSKRSAPVEMRRVRSSSLDGGVTEEGYEESILRMTRNSRVSGTSNEGKKKKTEDSPESLRKSKFDSLMASSQKMQVPKVKIAEKISALQQLVSPFGKTDQASVLMETITCIRILQEQVQLLSDPFLKSSCSKGQHNSWGEMEGKEREEAKHDLRSKGLCLVPVSSIPQVHRETNRPDYWMPTYRSCLYR